MEDLAILVTAITQPVVLISVAWLNYRVRKIDHAVNGKQPGVQPMVSQVEDIHKITKENGN